VTFSGMTLEERIKYDPGLANYAHLFDEMAEQVAKAKKALADLERRHEIVSEQAYFAQELVETIQHHCKHYTRATELKSAISRSIENSYFEI
jgi:hypothetical protein